MISKKSKILLAALTLIFSVVSAGIGFSLLGDSTLGFMYRFLCGLCFIITPILVIQLIIAIFQKDEKKKDEKKKP